MRNKLGAIGIIIIMLFVVLASIYFLGKIQTDKYNDGYEVGYSEGYDAGYAANKGEIINR